MTYALRVARDLTASALPVRIAWRIAPEALIALEFRGYPFHGSAIGRRLPPSCRPVLWPGLSQDHDRPATDRLVPASAIYTWA
jgi:hypothetical protein